MPGLGWEEPDIRCSHFLIRELASNVIWICRDLLPVSNLIKMNNLKEISAGRGIPRLLRSAFFGGRRLQCKERPASSQSQR